jgi:hypothetical protein
MLSPTALAKEKPRSWPPAASPSTCEDVTEDREVRNTGESRILGFRVPTGLPRAGVYNNLTKLWLTVSTPARFTRLSGSACGNTTRGHDEECSYYRPADRSDARRVPWSSAGRRRSAPLCRSFTSRRARRPGGISPPAVVPTARCLTQRLASSVGLRGHSRAPRRLSSHEAVQEQSNAYGGTT